MTKDKLGESIGIRNEWLIGSILKTVFIQTRAVEIEGKK